MSDDKRDGDEIIAIWLWCTGITLVAFVLGSAFLVTLLRAEGK